MPPEIKDKEYKLLLAQGCKQSFELFVKTFWSEFVTQSLEWNWHHSYLCTELQKIGERVGDREESAEDYTIINVPPGTSKSSIVTVLFPLWCWTIAPHMRFICGSYSSTISEDLSDKARRVFTSSLYNELFPYIGIRSDAKTKLENLNKGERYTTSTGAGATGLHADIILIDDPLNPQQSASDAERETANKWIVETLSTRKTNKKISATILIMQRLHEDDPTGFILSKNLKVNHICLPAELSENVRPENLKEFYIDGLMDIKRMDREILSKANEQLGSYQYSGQFLQQPVNLKGGMFQRSWFEVVDYVPYDKKVVHFQLDTAYTSKALNDPTGILSYFKKGEDIYLTNWTAKRLEFPQLCSFIQTHVREHGYNHKSLVRIEPKASGKSLVQQLKAETNLNIVESANPTKDKVTRASEITAKVEAGRVKLIKGNWNDAFLNEVCVFPKGKHDEAVDCLTEVCRTELLKDKTQNLYEILGRFA